MHHHGHGLCVRGQTCVYLCEHTMCACRCPQGPHHPPAAADHAQGGCAGAGPGQLLALWLLPPDQVLPGPQHPGGPPGRVVGQHAFGGGWLCCTCRPPCTSNLAHKLLEPNDEQRLAPAGSWCLRQSVGAADGPRTHPCFLCVKWRCPAAPGAPTAAPNDLLCPCARAPPSTALRSRRS
jgi:hypothetical protein